MVLAFDTRDTIDPSSIAGQLPGLIAESTVSREGKVTLVRLRLNGQPLTRFFAEGNAWSLDLGEAAGQPALPVEPQRGIDDRGQTSLVVPLPASPACIGWESGPAGLPLAVATALGRRARPRNPTASSSSS